ncbi:hypothetical protein OSTOST_17198, partial [Ostertagia ostertagi]
MQQHRVCLRLPKRTKSCIRGGELILRLSSFPFMLISVSYTKIFYTVSNHRSLAVDAHIRDERIKLRVATMMLTVIVVFALCWLPLYAPSSRSRVSLFLLELVLWDHHKPLMSTRTRRRAKQFDNAIGAKSGSKA